MAWLRVEFAPHEQYAYPMRLHAHRALVVFAATTIPALSAAQGPLLYLSDEGGDSFVITEQVVRTGNFATALEVHNYARPSSTDPPYNSHLVRYMFDCVEPRSKLIEATFFAGRSTRGEVTSVLRPSPGVWSDVIPGSAHDMLRTLACDPFPFDGWTFAFSEGSRDYSMQTPRFSFDGTIARGWLYASLRTPSSDPSDVGTMILRYEYDCARWLRRSTYRAGYREPLSSGRFLGAYGTVGPWESIRPDSAESSLAAEACGVSKKSKKKRKP